ncbi:MAG: sensor histidine kinase [Acetatifactor sp.]
MLDQRNIERKLSVIMPVLAAMMILVLLVLLGTRENVEITESRKNENIVQVTEYTCEEVVDPDAPIGIHKRYCFNLDLMERKDVTLAFYTVHQYARVFLGEEEVYSAQPSEENWICKTIGSNWTMVPIYREDYGKQVCVEVTPVYESFRDRQVDFLIGSDYLVFRERLRKDAVQLILSILTIFVGTVFLSVFAHNLIRKRKENSLAALGLFSIILGVWRMMDTRFTPFLFPDRPVLVFYLSVGALMIGIIPFVKWIKHSVHQAIHPLLDWYGTLTAGLCIVLMLMELIGGDLRDYLIYIHIDLGIGAVLIVCSILYERIKYPDHEKKGSRNNLFIICVIGFLADMVSFFTNGNSAGLVFTLAAFLVYIICVGIVTMYRYSDQEQLLAVQERQLAEQERCLTEQRIAALKSQIQPHFIYNTLGSIQQLCLEQPEKAAELTCNFSKYLRGNFSELDNDEPVPFSRELQHIKHYISIEQVRFPDVTFTFDIQAENFFLPALSVQPLVENAIKHGIMGLESGGIVRLITYETDSHTVIRVEDNGVGFQTESLDDGKVHVGLKNIRERLAVMCGGTLMVESSVGKGTVAEISIPKEENL